LSLPVVRGVRAEWETRRLGVGAETLAARRVRRRAVLQSRFAHLRRRSIGRNDKNVSFCASSRSPRWPRANSLSPRRSGVEAAQVAAVAFLHFTGVA
jgi:hypothetical protein